MYFLECSRVSNELPGWRWEPPIFLCVLTAGHQLPVTSRVSPALCLASQNMDSTPELPALLFFLSTLFQSLPMTR